jgi:fructan beta-fructosidase
VRDRPELHFTPRENWLNDPNGLVHRDGVWHLFFQHNPHGDHWGDMSWGHATSADLVSWDERPVAIRQDADADGNPSEYVFSGSAVVDGDDLVAVYTSVALPSTVERPGLQTQHLARSSDGGETWVKDPANPVLDRGSTDFRDPKVFRDPSGDRWLMVAVEALDHRVVIYSADDLHHWTLLSEFDDPSLDAGPWECPDLFPLRVDGGDEVCWVLLVSVLHGAPGGGSGMRCWIGDFDGTTYVAWHSTWLDEGRDCYAAVTWNDAPDGRRVMIGWLSNWDYARVAPSTGWRGAMTLPRDLTLVGTQAGPRLRQEVSPELSGHDHLDVVVRPGEPLVLHDGALTISCDGAAGELVVERATAAFSESYGSVSRVAVPLVDGGARVQVWVDHGSVEIFADDGLVVFSYVVFPHGPPD